MHTRTVVKEVESLEGGLLSANQHQIWGDEVIDHLSLETDY